MNTYTVKYLINGTEEASREVEADDMFELVSKLESEILYMDQFLSIFSITLNK